MLRSTKPDPFTDIQRHMVERLYSAGAAYLRTGLDLFHTYRNKLRTYQGENYLYALGLDLPPVQPCVGNLTISIELMLKALIAWKQPSDVFDSKDKNTKKVLELIEILQDPNSYSDEALARASKNLSHIFKSSDFKAKSLIECRKLVSKHYQPLHIKYENDLDYLVEFRNSSVHFTVPHLYGVEVACVAFAALKIADLLKKTSNPDDFFQALELPFVISPNTEITRNEADDEFFNEFQAYDYDKARSAKQKLDKATERSKAIQPGLPVSKPNTWEHYAVGCPVCPSKASGYGKTSIKKLDYQDNEGEPYQGFYQEQMLVFNLDRLHCSHCGLILTDIEEMRFTPMPLKYDRTEDIELFAHDIGKQVLM